MNRSTFTFVRSFLLALALAPAALFAADAPPPKELIEKAIAVHGGRAALAALPSTESRGSYESNRRGTTRVWPVVWYERTDGAYRTELSIDFRGRKVTMIELYDGKVCKRRFGTSWDDMPLDEARERATHRLGFLAEAAGRNPVGAGEGTEGGVDVWRVEVPDGRGTATLSFSKEDGHLVALEYPGTEAEGMGTKKEVLRKLVFRDLRKVGPLVLPFDVERTTDGKPDGRLRFESIVPLRDFDEAWLKVPDPRRRFIPSDELAN